MRIIWQQQAESRGEKKTFRLSVGKSEGKRPLGRHKHRWKDNISMVIKKYERFCVG
jgi:hypothetical protein